MESFTSSSLVLITGANGHVAQHVVSQLLPLAKPQRPKVRATVRSETAAAGLKTIFSSQLSSGELEFVFVKDIAEPGAFDHVLQDVTHIAHIASPLVVGVENAERDLLKPAINGTMSLLRSAVKIPTLRSIVVTSSFAACQDPMYGLRPGYTYSPKDWNPISYETAADSNLDLSIWPETYRVFITYMASKKLAEKAAWDFFEKEKPSWRLSTICPSYIGGPNILPLAKGADSLSFSQKLIWNVANSKPEDKLPEIDFPVWVDVRDVAKCEILALQSLGANGQRFIVSPHVVTYANVARVLREKLGLDVSRQEQSLKSYDVDTSNCGSVLGVEGWIEFEDMVLDTVRQVQAN